MSAIYAIVQATSPRLDLVAGARLRRRSPLVLMAAFVALEARIENPIMPLRILRLRGLVTASLVRGFLVTGMYSTFFLGTLYLEHVRHYSAAADGGGVPAVDDHGRRSSPRGSPRGWSIGSARCRCSSPGWRARSSACCCSAPSGPDTAFFPTIFFACFAIGFGIGNAFMPLLTIAMADVPPADAGLGSGITNVSQQVSGALGLAVLGTIAADHTKALLAAHHAVTSSLISGYHVAFLTGAAVIAVGMLLAFALLRPRRSQTELSLAESPAGTDIETLPSDLEIERSAA